ncbi:MAG: tripartite tricarboxylate transporter substrate binding protein [Betaproteobacteria bacterium]|nr:tripartite tricarboxylate transporter substrate binding protein [Betaproteobacteria bacterium]
MQNKRYSVVACAAALVACVSAQAWAQNYPSKPVRVIAPYPPGGGADTAARIISQALTEHLKQQVIVDNRPGASGQIGTELAARAAPDGYTLLLGNVGPNAIRPASGARIPYDPINDFAPVSLVAVSQYALTVHPSLPVKSVKDLVALAKAQPGEIAFGSTGVAGGPHLAGELLSNLAGIRLLHVAYKGGGPVTTALLSGEVSMSFSSLPTVLPFRASGKLRVVAVTGAKRSPFAPDIPAVAETIRGYEVTQWYGVLAPAKTDQAIVSILASGIAKSVASDSVKQQFAASGATATSTTPAAFKSLIQNEIAKWKKVFATGSVKLD